MIPAGTLTRTRITKPDTHKTATIVVTPVPGPSDSARIECTGCPGVLRVSGFSPLVIRRLAAAVARDHSCSSSAKS